MYYVIVYGVLCNCCISSFYQLEKERGKDIRNDNYYSCIKNRKPKCKLCVACVWHM